MTDELTDFFREYEALKRWELGIVPCFSTGVCGSVTAGYGHCDDYGYWEFPLYPGEKYLKLLKTLSRQD